MRTTLWTGTCLLLALACGCTPSADKQPTPDKQATDTSDAPELVHGLTPEQAKQVLVKIGEREITLGDFAEQLASQSPYLRARYNSPERRREFLENMIRFELLAMEAKKRGHDQRPEVQRVRKQVMVQQMMTKMFDEEGVKLSDITDAEIKAYYDKNQSEFNKPAQVRASHILMKDEATAKEVLAKLKAKPGDMQLFRDLAREHNLDPVTKARFGDLTFFYEDASLPEQPQVPAPVRAAAFTLDQTGAVYDTLIKSDEGFHVLKLTAKRAKLERSLDDARRLIQNRLWREKREKAIEAFVDGLRAKAEVKENPALLSEVHTGATDGANGPGKASPPHPTQAPDADDAHAL